MVEVLSKMEVTLSLLIVVLITWLNPELGGVTGYNSDPFSDGSNSNGNSSLCRVVRDTRKSVLTSFSNQYATTGSYCDISEHCANVTCTAEFSRGRVNAGLHIDLCKEYPELLYWANIPGQWDQPWNHTFSSKNSNGLVQRQEITGSPSEAKPTEWFIKVVFSITHGYDRINQQITYISTLSVLQICPAKSISEESCKNTTLLDFPRLPKSQVCEFTVLAPSDIAEDILHHDIALLKSQPSDSRERSGGNPSSTRSSRNANANANPWNPEGFRKSSDVRAKKFEPGQPFKSSPGEPCSPQDIFFCGHGASCVASANGSGTCQCLPDFRFDEPSKACVKRPKPSPPNPTDDPSSDSLNSRSYSSAVGAIISILILISIAAGIYFGTKYNYFARIRHRIPVLRCWPFRRSQPWEDNVTMVNPVGPPDDDDPLLL